ncbi:MAG: sigma-54-dependent Fis family transcriptional regulator [Calditrichaeota bacterium]|nr:MAG: sigma-54-dependent Fis family transcriptional regulator [Calditrichota bacterium]
MTYLEPMTSALNLDSEAATIFIVDDDPYVRESLKDVLTFNGYACLEAGDGKQAAQMIAEQNLDLVLLDLRLPRLDGMEVLKRSLKLKPTLPIIMISGQATIQLAVEATKLGAYDFIEKPLEAERILLTIRNALEKSRLQQQRDRLLDEARENFKIIFRHPTMQKVVAKMQQAAKVDSTVLITGESGTGKDLVARGIHYASPRSVHPFVPVNCSAIPETLIESELFGHQKGAFTGATAPRKGKFLLANRGTLFLDEIGDMNLLMQAKILRAVEEKKIDPLGAAKPLPVDVRIICATHQNLQQLVEQQKFREDLYYRINVIQIHLPPLRERLDDLQPLAEYFLARICQKEGLPMKRFGPEVWPYLRSHHWPGNIRELRNVVERAAVLTMKTQIDLATLSEALETPMARLFGANQGKTLREARQEFERKFIQQALVAHKGKILETARAIGIQRSHLWKKLKQLGIYPRE